MHRNNKVMLLSAVNTRKLFPVNPDRRYGRTATAQRELALTPGLSGIADTLRYMKQATDQFKTHPQIRELALRLTRNLQQKDYHAEIKTLFDYVQKRIRYVKDINGVETLQTPIKTLEYGAGDCDDKSMLLAALVESLGHQTRFRAIGMRPGQLSHVSVEALINGQWVNLETTEPVAMGWAPPYIAEEMTSDALGNLFSSAWGAIKSAGRTFESQVIKKLPFAKAIDSTTNKILSNKIVQAAASVISVVPGPWMAVGMAIKVAGTAQALRAQDSAARRMANQMKQAASGQPVDNVEYVIDPATQMFREATPND